MVNLIVAWRNFRYIKKLLSFSMPSVEIQNMPSRYFNHRKGFKPLAFKNLLC